MGNQPAKEATIASIPRGNGLLNINNNGNNHIGNINGTSMNSDSSKSNNKNNKNSLSRKEKKAKVSEGIMQQIVCVNARVRGGYLAPYGNYKYLLDCDWGIVRSLIVGRRLAPFYTPLEDDPCEEIRVNGSLDKDKIRIKIISSLSKRGLHEKCLKKDVIEDDDTDPDLHRINQSHNSLKRRDMKEFQNNVKIQAWELQQEQENIFQQQIDNVIDDKIVELYTEGDECPICFLFMPQPMNETLCCHQKLCTECFIQMKRLPPHIPHDQPESQDLISECVKCPFCATEPFFVKYRNEKQVSPDDVRPQWKNQLTSAKRKIARRELAATALHWESAVGDSSLEDRLVEQTLRLSLLDK